MRRAAQSEASLRHCLTNRTDSVALVGHVSFSYRLIAVRRRLARTAFIDSCHGVSVFSDALLRRVAMIFAEMD